MEGFEEVSLVDDFDRILDIGRTAEKKGLLKKGQKPTDKRNRVQILRSYARMAEENKRRIKGQMQIYFNGAPCPPSSTPLSQLRPMFISELTLETRHTGKVLIVRPFGEPVRAISVDVGIEDASGNVDGLALCNLHPSLSGFDVVPQHCVLAIKEPYYHTTIHDSFTVRVDHPSDVIYLPVDSPLYPSVFRPAPTSLSAMTFKSYGNTHYAQRNYFQALESYTCGIAVAKDEDKLILKDLYRNRSLVNQILGRFEPALSDAYSSLIEDTDGVDEEKLNTYNNKAYFRAGRAHYELRQFSEAERKFKHALKLKPDDHDAAHDISRVHKRYDEETTGTYDFETMCTSASQGKIRLDYASFTDHVRVRVHPQKGRGLFSNRPIKAGDLILCEKAFDIAHERDALKTTFAIINTVKATGKTGVAVTLLFRVIEKLRYNPVLAQAFLNLPDGGYKPKLGAQQIDGETVIDAFEVECILDHNSFVDHASDAAGIWITAASIGHACDGNAVRVKLGDMLVIRAARDIAQDEEITTRHSFGWDYVHAVQFLQWKGGITCKCPVCIAEEETTSAEMGGEQMYLQRDCLKDLLQKHKHANNYRPPWHVVKQVEELYEKVGKTYGKAFAILPRLAMVEPAVWLAKSYAAPASVKEWEKYALEALRNQGFMVIIENNSISIDRKHAITTTDAIPVAIHLRDIYRRKGQGDISAAFEAFAREIYQTVTGSMRGFEQYDR